MDVMMLVKGVCQAASVFERVDPDIADRHLDLMRAALTAHESTRPLRGRAPTIEDIEHAFDAEAAEQSQRATA